MSQANLHPPAWPSNFIPGVGRVPGGPRVRTRTTPAGDTEFQIGTGSTVVIPKSEEQEIDLNTLPTFEQIPEMLDNMPEEGEIVSEEVTETLGEAAQDEPIKLEPETEDPAELPEDHDDYENHFARLLAAHNAAARSDSDTSQRQDVRSGSLRERSDQRGPSTARDRSRSPRGSRQSTRSERASSSPMFFPEQPRRRDRDSRDSGLGGSIASNSSMSMSNTPTPGQPPEEEWFEDRCRCPISYNCSHRRPAQLDCRPLVREPMPRWEERDQEDFDRLKSVVSPGENFTTVPDLVKVIGFINTFEQTQDARIRKQQVKHMESWILEMEDVTLQSQPERAAATNQVVPRLTQFLNPRQRVARRSRKLPIYIEEELLVLEKKWAKGDFNGNIKRGLTMSQTLNVNGFPVKTRYLLDKMWEFYVDARYFGAGELVNGQIWESRVELARDGVHAAIQGGIAGTHKKGAYSIVLGEYGEKNDIGYADKDMGNVIEYIGTALKDQPGLGPTNDEDPHMHNPHSWNPTREPTKATQALMKSFETREPVRIIRSWQMHSMVKNRPHRKGYRYDGLYQVVGKTPMKEARQIWSFRLKRIENPALQGRLRGFRRNEVYPDSTGRQRGHYYQGR